MMDRVPGSQAAAPIPMTARAAMSEPVLGARAPKREPAANTATPASISRFLPNRSLRVPKASMKAGEGQRVGVDDPLQLRDAGVERGLHVGEGDGHDGGVEEGQEEDAADAREREPRAPPRE